MMRRILSKFGSKRQVDEFISMNDQQEIMINPIPYEPETDPQQYIPEFYSHLKHRIVKVPEEIQQASGIRILSKEIKSLLFTTDVALIKNTNAESVMAVYPFTPEFSIMQAISTVAAMPVFMGVGGGTTSGERSVKLAFQAEQLGAYGVVVNAPMGNEVIQKIQNTIDIPVIGTISSAKDDFIGKYDAGVDIFNVSAAKDTAKIVSLIREKLGNEVPIIATGGPTSESILETIQAGANAITYTPPTSAEIFAKIMQDYRQ